MPIADSTAGPVSFVEEGAGSPVVLLHATAGSAGQWRALADHLAPRHRVIVTDLPGYGTAAGICGIAGKGLSHHADIVRALAAYAGEPVHLVGHSFGGAVALKAAMVHPAAVRSLTVIEPVAFNVLRYGSDEDRRLSLEVDALAGVIAASAASGDADRALAHFIDFWNGRGAWPRLAARTRSALSASVGAIINDFAAGRQESWSADACREIGCPTLAVMGMQSRTHSQRVTEMVAESIPGARIHMVLDAGHMMPLTHPSIVNPMIAAFLAEIDLRACRSLADLTCAA